MRSHGTGERFLAVGLSAMAGFVDAVAFIELGGYFVSFMTGNTVQFGAGLVASDVPALLPILLVALFVAGVTLASLAGRFGGRRRKSLVLLLVAALLLAAAALVEAGAVFPAVVALALAMGAENAVFERDGTVTIGLTYMTGTLVKAGEGIATALTGGERLGWVWHLALWLALAGGAVVGALLYRGFALHALWFPAGASVVFLLASLVLPDRRSARA